MHNQIKLGYRRINVLLLLGQFQFEQRFQLLQIGHAATVFHIEQCAENRLPCLSIEITWKCLFGHPNAARLTLCYLHVTAKEQHMHHSHQAEQIQLIRPAAPRAHLDALEGLIVVHIVECLIRRKKFGVNGDTKVDQLQTELVRLCTQTVKGKGKSAFSAYRICKDFLSMCARTAEKQMQMQLGLYTSTLSTVCAHTQTHIS